MKPNLTVFTPKINCFKSVDLGDEVKSCLEMKGHMGETVHLDAQSGEFPVSKIIR